MKTTSSSAYPTEAVGLAIVLLGSLLACSKPRPYTGDDAGVDSATGQGGSGANGGVSGNGGASHAGFGGASGMAGEGALGGHASGAAGATARSSTGGGVGGGAGVSGNAGVGGAASSGGVVGTGGVVSSGGVVGTGGAGGAGNGGAGRGGAGGDACGSGCSCRSLPRVCGPLANEDCCTLRPVPATMFLRYDNALYPATISGYSMDRFEVTVGRFRAFVEAGKGVQTSPPATGSGANPKNTLDQGWQSLWTTQLLPTTAALRTDLMARHSDSSTWTEAPGANENLPMAQVSWAEAQAFCIWNGGRLPTEAEWELAAVGGMEQREFPFPHAADCTLKDPGNPSNCCNYMNSGCGQLLPVGSKPTGDGRWGHADLGGNVAEWAIDARSAGNAPAPPVPCYDCSNLDPSQDAHLTMGLAPGTFWTNATVTSFLNGYDGRANSIGIRCVRD